MTNFRIDTHNKSGKVMLWIETSCGYKPVIGWDGVDGVKEFANMLLNFCEYRKEKKEERNKVKEVSEYLIRQALGEDEYMSEEPA